MQHCLGMVGSPGLHCSFAPQSRLLQHYRAALCEAGHVPPLVAMQIVLAGAELEQHAIVPVSVHPGLGHAMRPFSHDRPPPSLPVEAGRRTAVRPVEVASPLPPASVGRMRV